MIQIRTDGKSWLSIHGHAGYAEIGKDIVCAGISALFYSLREALHNQTSDVISDDDTGLIVIKPGNESQLLMQSYTRGMEMIAEQCNENVEFQREYLEGNTQN